MTLTDDWRHAFGQGDFPFFWVQLANFGNAAKNGHWMRVQEGQVKATALKGTGVAIINDIGAATDIHPTNKQDVGKRLALLARHVAYGENGFVWSSPLYRQTTREGNSLRVWFNHAGTGLRTRGDGPLKGFVIAGSDGKWVPATAEIEGATVLVSSPEIADPQAVRYAWDYNPDANLVNSAGLPASLFRSDESEPRP
jgi:sialate O-acetylesterase